MAITYKVLTTIGKSAKVQFTNDQGLIYVKSITIPNGCDVNSEVFGEIINAQIVSIEYKVQEGILEFYPEVQPVTPVQS